VSKADKEQAVRQAAGSVAPMDVILTTNFDWWNPLTWSARMIREKTSSKYSHVFVGGGNGIGYTTDWRFKEVNLVDYLLEQDAFLILRYPGLTDEQKFAGLKAAAGEVGKLYPVSDILSMIVQNTIDPGAYRLKVDSPNKICSQCVGWLFRDVMKYPLLPQKHEDTSMLVPGDFEEQPGAVEIARWPARK
jgi:hypothetical protein